MGKKTVYVVIEDGEVTSVFGPAGMDLDVQFIDLDSTIPEVCEAAQEAMREIMEDPEYEEYG